MVDFVPLHCHSTYSLLDGMAQPESVAKAAADYGCPACSLNDHGTCGGLYSFQKGCEKHGIKPLLGMEAYFVEDASSRDPNSKRHHLNLIAKNLEGYRNLIALSTLGYTRGFYSRPRIDMSMLESRKGGLMALSACAVGVVCGPFLQGQPILAKQRAEDFKDMFGDDFYMEIMEHRYDASSADKANEFVAAMKQTYELAHSMDIVPVYTYDSHYCDIEDATAHDVLLSISTRNTVKNDQRYSFNSQDFYMKSPQELSARLKGNDHLLTNTMQVAEKVESGIINPSSEMLPAFDLPPGVTSEEDYLKQLIRDGMIVKGIFQKQEYRDRIVQELEVIITCGFTRYFLVLWDIINHARLCDIRVGPGRGSGVASLCLYCMGITALDPIEHDLLFSRFLNPSRISPPDVDIDFDYERQGDMFKYVSDKYGEECTTRIGTYGSLKARDAVKRVGKALDVGGDWELAEHHGKSWKSGRNTLQIVDRISKSIPQVPDMTIAKALAESDETKSYQHQYPELFALAQKVEGNLSNSGVHPAGVVICGAPVRSLIPLRITNKVLCTQFDMKQVEELGLLKFDFLALKTLTIIEKCVKMVVDRHAVKLSMDALRPDDPNVFAILNAKDVEGVFQFEGRGISETLANIGADSFEDMIAGVALYRPGPMDNIPDFCDYKHKRKPVVYLHPIMEELLHKTYGMMVYQEQVQLISMKMAGFTAAESDKFRKGMGKKDVELIESLRVKFLQGSMKNGVAQPVANEVFELCAKFAGYGFNRAHAAAYAFLAYQCAWLKTYYRTEFMASLLTFTCSSQDEDKRNRYEKNCRKHGISILPVHINQSGSSYDIEGKEGRQLRRPLTALKGVGEAAVKVIEKSKPFADMRDFVRKTSSSVNKSIFAVLAESGCMKCWGADVDSLKAEFEKMRDVIRKEKRTLKDLDSVDGNFLDLA